ncbi:hypothetical protein F4813DRAFT_61716 [Daldinia decipiens]|uniref:uncharacterized protein n=1 Tax=Daldinia decipiens TaxID=326647 RepID=UPI0020C23F93|nr:uncharacterized protein F4813DRAFT_61716 [Daldinia decipiens]KAI1657857.1 hypothetical protein F4813DRAFT_61716 [Daldinia decipiens]
MPILCKPGNSIRRKRKKAHAPSSYIHLSPYITRPLILNANIIANTNLVLSLLSSSLSIAFWFNHYSSNVLIIYFLSLLSLIPYLYVSISPPSYVFARTTSVTSISSV